jgi:Ran-binding protein 1
MADFAKLLDENQKKLAAGSQGGEDEGGEDDVVEEVESTAEFAPKVHLEEIEVVTGEEDETVLYDQRSKLYVYDELMLDKGTGTKSWLSRGVGQFKILQHKENNRLRCLMREHNTKKTIANFVLDPRVELVPHAGDDKVWIWIAHDYNGIELQETTFMLKLKFEEEAQTFAKEFKRCKDMMSKVLESEKDGDTKEAKEETTDAVDGVEGDSAEADAAAEALAGLTTNDEGGEKTTTTAETTETTEETEKTEV